MLLILLKSAACLAILMVFYKLFLERLAIHKFKRFYLLGALIVSFVIPFITFIEYVEPQFNVPYFEVDHSAPLNLMPVEEAAIVEPTNFLPIILWSIYGIGVLLFLTKFCINLFGIVSKINKNEKHKHNNFIRVLLQDLVVPHTFFNYIFINKTKFETKAIPQEVLLHEQTHAKQKHTLDILFIELLQVVFWFNPLLYFLKKDIKLNHEFLADEAVLKQGIDSSTYQETLLQFTSNVNGIPLAHAINYSLIKKRFTIMKTQTSKKAVWLRSLLLLPLLGGLLFSFSSTVQVEKEPSPLLEISKTPQELLEPENLKTEYTAKKVSPKKPSIEQFEAWKDKSQFALWLDGKHIQNSELNKFTHEDIEYFNGLLIKPEAKNEKFPQSYYAYLYTKKGFEAAFSNSNIEKEAKFEKIVNNILRENTTKEPILLINGIKCDGCELNLSKKGVENMILGTTTGDPILSFKIKFPGKSVETIKGDALNTKAIAYLNETALGVVVQLFDIKTTNKTTNKTKLKPVLITLVDKNDKNYSNSPHVKLGQPSTLPPPPPPPSKAPEYIKGKKLTLNEIIEKTPKSVESGFEMLENGESHYFTVYQGEKTYYNKDGYITDDKGTILPPPPPPPAPPAPITPINEKQNITKTAFVKINGSTHFKVTDDGASKYYNNKGYLVDKNGKALSTAQVDGSKVIPGQRISKVYQNGKVVVEFKKTWKDEDRISFPEPPMPPEPVSTERHIKNMMSKNAAFYFNGEKVSSEKALELVKTNEKLNVSTHTNNGISTVHLSNKPISIVNGQASFSQDKKKVYEERKKAMESRKEIRDEMLEKRKEMMEERKEMMKEKEEERKDLREEMIEERKEQIEEHKAMLLERRQINRRPLAEQFKGMEKNGGEFFYEGDKISEAKAIELIKNNPKLNVSMSNLNGKSTVHLSKKGIKTVNGKIVRN
ncbi:M56 family metallopeptidase [Lacinutrix chionoecetis]